MKLRPLQDRILVRRVEEESKTKGGIIIPDSAKEKPAEGEVVSVGSGKVADDGKKHQEKRDPKNTVLRVNNCRFHDSLLFIKNLDSSR